MIFDFIKKLLFDASIDEDKKLKIIAKMKKIIISQSLSCNRCHALAVPILETKNRYRCASCGRQFLGPNYNLDFSEFNNIGWSNLEICANNKGPLPLKDLESYYEQCIGEIRKDN